VNDTLNRQMTLTTKDSTQMKTKTLLTCLATILILASSCKQSQQSAPPTPSPSPTNVKPIAVYPPAVIGKPYPGKGVIKIIKRQEGWIEIDHEDIPELMPAMVMEWSLEKSSLFDGLKVGDKVAFTVVETGKGELITEIKKIQE
jgi:protein SCO1